MVTMLAPIAASGGVHVETTPLLTVEEMQTALKRAADVNYRAPGA
jgi:hypothetical protein